MKENLNQIDQINGNHFHEQEMYHNENIQSPFLSQSNIRDNLELKSVKKANFTRKILSSIDIPPLQFTPYVSILPQKINSSQNNDNLTDNELISFKRDTIIYLNHNVLNCDKEIISGEKIICEEETKNGVIAILIETKSDNDMSKFKEEILLNCGDDYFANEDSIVYERGTDCILGHEDEVKDEKDDERFKLNHNVDESLIISIRKCFNCSSPYHSFNNCQFPLNKELIKINREKFNNEQDNKSNNGNGQQQFNSRYYIEYEKDFIFNIFLPGVISDVLKDALGILESGEEPPYYKRMRVYGYPPGYWGDNEGDDPLKPKKDRLSKLEEEQWNSATLKIYNNNESESDDSLEESGINNDSTDNDSENSENFDSKNRKNYSGTEENITKNTINPCTESQKETSEEKAQKPQQEKKKKIPLVYYPGLNLDFAKFEKKINKIISKTNLNNNDANHNYYGQQFALYSTNTDQYYQSMPDWYYNRYSEHVNIGNGWYNYENPPPPGTTNSLWTYPSSWIITSGLEVQPPPPGTITSSFEMPQIFTTSFEMQLPPHEITPSLETDTLFNSTSNIGAVFNHSQNLSIGDKSALSRHKSTSIQSTTNSLSERQLRTFQDHQIMKNENHNNNIEVSNVEDCLEEDNDMDLSD